MILTIHKFLDRIGEKSLYRPGPIGDVDQLTPSLGKDPIRDFHLGHCDTWSLVSGKTSMSTQLKT